MAIVAINIFAITATSQGVCFKYASKGGASIFDYMIFRNFFIGFGGGIQLLYFKINPITGFPRNLVKDLIIRVVAGQLTFGIINFTISLISIGTALILFETNSFWVAILACLVLKERV